VGTTAPLLPLALMPEAGHNRWHPDLPAIRTIGPGDTIVVALRDGDDCQITPNSTVASVAGLEPRRAHAMSGPYYVSGAQPGDQMRVSILALSPGEFGWTTILPGRFGILRDHYQGPFLARWDLTNGVATSVDLPGVEIPAAPFLGLIGTAPSHASMATATDRERRLVARGGSALLPDPAGAVPSEGPAATEGLRTVPPRETGGNFDIKELGVGSILTLPVEVDGGLLSLGDMHFAQGDGESSGTAIECGGVAEIRVDLVRRHEQAWCGRFPHFEFTRGGRRFMATVGLSITPDGECTDMDVTVAVRNALLEMESYLVQVHDFTSGQAHVLISTAVDVRISSIVNLPTPVVTAQLPLDILVSGRPSVEHSGACRAT
jgi:formamidase